MGRLDPSGRNKRREEKEMDVLLRQFRRVGERLRALRLGIRGTVAIATGCLFLGLLLATEVSLPRFSEANRAHQVVSSVQSSAAIPGSFADLAARLSPTVVNIQVIKIEKLGTDMPKIGRAHV